MDDAIAFRAEVRDWFATADRPDGLYDYGPTPQAQDIAMGRAWHRMLDEAGYACLHWPTTWGGRDASVAEQAAFAEEAALADVPRQLNIVGPDLAGPVLMVYGTEEQQQTYLPRIRTGEDMWCQLFSEPGAGSDLAAARTRARHTEDGWVVDGQKVWTSGADGSDLGILLARTGGPGHGGLSMFVVSMSTPGIEVRPLVQIDGESKFNEVYFTGAVLPHDALIGEEGHGWRITGTTLGRERLSLGSNAVGMIRALGEIADAARERGRLDESLSASITDLWLRTWLLRTTWERAVATSVATGDAAYSVLKVMTSETYKEIGNLGIEALGLDALDSESDRPLVQRMLVGHAQTLLGGTSEIQRNILAERLLGLPREQAAKA